MLYIYYKHLNITNIYEIDWFLKNGNDSLWLLKQDAYIFKIIGNLRGRWRIEMIGMPLLCVHASHLDFPVSSHFL